MSKKDQSNLPSSIQNKDASVAKGNTAVSDNPVAPASVRLEQGKRIMITGVNSLIGHSLFEEMRNDHIAIHSGEKPHRFLGTLTAKENDKIQVPSSSITLLDLKQKPKSFQKGVYLSDIIVIDMVSGTDIEHAFHIVKSLSSPDTAKAQTLVLITSVMVWASTPAKDSEFTDNDYQQRVPPPRYQLLKNLENLALAATQFNKNLSVHVVCSGLPYGNGESNDIFYEFFRRAWLSLHPDLAALPIVGQGNNVLPTIHVTDLARSINHLVTSKVTKKYLIAVDQAQDGTLAGIMKTISVGLGSGAVKHVDLPDVIDEDWSEFINLNLKLKTSAELEQATFWHCRNGIHSSTMKMLNEEFNLFHGLFPLKVFICGPPASGKTHYAKKFAAQYGIPHLTIAEIVETAKKLDGQFGDRIRAQIEELKDNAAAEYEKTRKKKDPDFDRASCKVRLPDETLTEMVLHQMNSAACMNKGFILDGYPRTISDAQQIFLEKDENAAAQTNNQDEEQKDNAVVAADDEAAAEDSSDPFPGFKVNQRIIPQYCIVLEGEDAILKQRVKELPAEKTEGTHYNEKDMDRRLKVYREANPLDSDQCEKDFFRLTIGEKNMLAIDCQMEEAKAQTLMQDHVEQAGKPCCINLITDADNKYLRSLSKAQRRAERAQKKEQEAQDDQNNEDLTESEKGRRAAARDAESSEEEDEVVLLLRREEEEAQRRATEEAEAARIAAEEEKARKDREEAERIKLEKIREEERDLLDKKSQPIRQYLMDNVVPHLTEGLIELCKNVPEDPIDTLSTFLLQRAQEIDDKILQEREREAKEKAEAKQKSKISIT